MENKDYDSWETVFKTGTDYEAELVCDRLRDADIPAVVMNKRDHAYNLTLGDMAQVKVLVPAEKLEAAAALLSQAPFTDEELAAAALAANPLGEEEVIEDSSDDKGEDA